MTNNHPHRSKRTRAKAQHTFPNEWETVLATLITSASANGREDIRRALKKGVPFIVTACNAHEELLAALKAALAYITASEALQGTTLSQAEGEKRIHDFKISALSIGHHAGHSYASIDLDKARAAIAKAESR